jgi:hypothetical protein
MSSKFSPAVATMGADIGKNSFHVIGLDAPSAIVLRKKWSREQLEARCSVFLDAGGPGCLNPVKGGPQHPSFRSGGRRRDRSCH